jgi:uncharacterized protein (TIGR03437 family)
MDLSVLRNKSALALGGLLALTAGAGSIQATTLLSTSATVANVAAMAVTGVTCNTLTGPAGSGQTITIHAVPAPLLTNTITVGIVQTPGIKVTGPPIMTLSATGAVAGTVSNATGIVLTVNSTAGCSNASGIVANTLVSGPNTIAIVLTAQSNAGAVNPDNGLNVTDTITSAASPLVAAAVTVTCGYSGVGPLYVPGAPRVVSVTSAANLGTPFTVVPGAVSAGIITPGTLPSWLVVSPIGASGTAGSNAVNFTVQAATGTTSANGCGTFAGTTQTYALPLSNLPAPAVTVLITLVATTPSILTVTPVPAAPAISMSYTKLSGVATTTTVNVTSSISTSLASTFYQAINFPSWLTVNYATGFIPVTVGKNLIFSTTTSTDSLAPGTYTATIFLQVANYADQPIVITLLVANKAPTLSVTSANPMPVLYTLGGNTPVSTITIASSDSPIPYTISFGGLLAPTLAPGLNEQLTGIAYSFGSNIAITYNPVLFESSAPGTVLSGTVTFTWGSTTPATVTVVTINLTVGSPGAILTSISPASIPTAAPGTVFNLALTGSGFVGGTDATLATKVGTVLAGTVNQDPNFHLTWINPSNMTLQITVPALGAGGVNGDTNLPFLVGGAGGPVYLGIVNGSSTTATGTAILTVGGNPIIYGATSSSSFTEVSGGALPSFAPYDMISIFGSNFCASQITFPAVSPALAFTNGGCTSTTILAGKPDSVYGVFPFSLTPDQSILPIPPVSSLWRNLTVTFYPHGTLSGGTPAPLLFATNGQINAIVPGALTAAPTEYDIVVGFGPSGAIATSAPFPVNIQATDPGIFTIGSDGQGPAAALNLSYSLINSANPAAMRSGAGNSDIIQLYVTGLGVPLPGSAVYTSDTDVCIGALNVTNNGYLTALNAQTSPGGTFGTIDGAVLNYSLFTGDLPPCVLASGITVTVGGQATATPTFAGFVDGTVAGLYQIDVKLPRTDTQSGDLEPNYPSTTGQFTTLLSPAQLPVYVTINSVTSQAGVYLNVAPRLGMLAPTNLSLEQLQPWTTGNAVVASLGTTSYSYALTAGVLPAGLTLITSSGLITGTVGANTAGSYVVTVTATDSAAIPLTGSVTFTVVVGGGLYVSYSGTPTVTNVFGTAGVSLPDIAALGGDGTYSYALTSSTLASPPTGMSLTIGQLVVGGTAKGGTYSLIVTATDTSTPPITGLENFTYTVALDMAYAVTTATPPAAGTTAIGTFTTTGNTTTPVHYTSSNPAFTIVDSTGVVSITGLSDGAATSTITATDTGTAPGTETGTHATQTFLVSITVTG